MHGSAGAGARPLEPATPAISLLSPSASAKPQPDGGGLDPSERALSPPGQEAPAGSFWDAGAPRPLNEDADWINLPDDLDDDSGPSSAPPTGALGNWLDAAAKAESCQGTLAASARHLTPAVIVREICSQAHNLPEAADKGRHAQQGAANAAAAAGSSVLDSQQPQQAAAGMQSQPPAGTLPVSQPGASQQPRRSGGSSWLLKAARATGQLSSALRPSQLQPHQPNSPSVHVPQPDAAWTPGVAISRSHPSGCPKTGGPMAALMGEGQITIPAALPSAGIERPDEATGPADGTIMSRVLAEPRSLQGDDHAECEAVPPTPLGPPTSRDAQPPRECGWMPLKGIFESPGSIPLARRLDAAAGRPLQSQAMPDGFRHSYSGITPTSPGSIPLQQRLQVAGHLLPSRPSHAPTFQGGMLGDTQTCPGVSLMFPPSLPLTSEVHVRCLPCSSAVDTVPATAGLFNGALQTSCAAVADVPLAARIGPHLEPDSCRGPEPGRAGREMPQPDSERHLALACRLGRQSPQAAQHGPEMSQVSMPCMLH